MHDSQGTVIDVNDLVVWHKSGAICVVEAVTEGRVKIFHWQEAYQLPGRFVTRYVCPHKLTVIDGPEGKQP